MNQLELIQQKSSEIHQILQNHHAGKAYIFGSCARQEETPASDIDFLVEFMNNATLFDQVHIQSDLEKLFNCKVDVVSKRGLSPYIRKHVLNEAIAI